jgi:hypothetical protein
VFVPVYIAAGIRDFVIIVTVVMVIIAVVKTISIITVWIISIPVRRITVVIVSKIRGKIWIPCIAKSHVSIRMHVRIIERAPIWRVVSSIVVGPVTGIVVIPE